MGARDRCVIDAESIVDMPPTVELGDREPLVAEAIGFRSLLADGLGGAHPSQATGFQVHFGSPAIPTLRGMLYFSAAIYLHRLPPEPAVRPVRHPQRREPLKNPDGSVMMREDMVFPEPSFAALQYALTHDGTSWTVEARLYDQRPTLGRVEPLFSFEIEHADLDAVAGDLVKATIARARDIP